MRSEYMKNEKLEGGDFVWIDMDDDENKKYSGWFFVTFIDNIKYFINVNNKSFKIRVTSNSSTDTSYIMRYNIKAIDMINNFTMPEINHKEIEKKILEKKLLTQIQSESMILYDLVNRKALLQKDIASRSDSIQNIKEQYENLIKNTLYKYVYGVHDLNEQAFEYVWINDKDIDIKIGDIIEVETKKGVARAIITKLESNKQYINHKSVIKVVTFPHNSNTVD